MLSDKGLFRACTSTAENDDTSHNEGEESKCGVVRKVSDKEGGYRAVKQEGTVDRDHCKHLIAANCLKAVNIHKLESDANQDKVLHSETRTVKLDWYSSLYVCLVCVFAVGYTYAGYRLLWRSIHGIPRNDNSKVERLLGNQRTGDIIFDLDGDAYSAIWFYAPRDDPYDNYNKIGLGVASGTLYKNSVKRRLGWNGSVPTRACIRVTSNTEDNVVFFTTMSNSATVYIKINSVSYYEPSRCSIVTAGNTDYIKCPLIGSMT